MNKLQLAAFRNAWLDQVVADAVLPPMAFKLAFLFMRDVMRTFEKQRSLHSFRGQEGYAAILGVTERHVRELFHQLRDRGHVEVKRAGRGNPNRTYPTLHDRQDSSGQTADDRNDTSGQDDLMTGTSVPDDRNSHDIMTGTVVPGNLIEENRSSRFGTGAKPSPDNSLRSESRLPTMKVVEPRLDGASQPPATVATFRVGETRRNSAGEEYRVTRVNAAARTVTVQWTTNGRISTVPAPAGALLVDAGDGAA